MELVRQKNVSTYIFFPLVDAAGAIVTGSANPDSESDTFADGTAPNGFADLTNEATEIGTDGWYYILLTQAEMNFDYIAIQVKSDDALTQHILIRTIAGDPALLATTAATDAIKTDTAAILIDTDTMEADLTTEIDANETKIDTLQTDVTAIKAITDAIPNAGALTDLKGDTAAILIDTDTLEADLKTYLDAIETNLEGDIEANDTLIDTAITDIAAVKADTAAILVDTDTMEADLTTEIDANETKIDTLQSDVTAIKALTDNLPANTDTELKEIKCLNKHNLAVEFDWDGNSDNNQTDFYGYDTAANTTTNDHATGKLIHIKGTTASFTDHKPATTIFIDADE